MAGASQIIKYLTEADVALLRKWGKWVEAQPSNPRGPDTPPPPVHKAPDVYLAKVVDAETIPAINEDDEAGWKDCWIYNLDKDHVPGQIKAGAVEAKVRVYNPTKNPIPGTDYFIVLKDKYGTYFPAPTPKTGVPFKNVEGTAAPDGALMQEVGGSIINGTYHIHVAKPSSVLDRRYLVNTSGAEVADEATASGSWLESQDYILFDDADGTPLSGEEWGPEPDTWKAKKNRLGFTIHGIKDEEGFLAIASQREISEVFGDIYGADLEQGATTDFRVWLFIDDVWEPSNFDPIEVQDIYLNTDMSIPVATMGACNWYSGRWVASNALCAVRNVE